MIDDETIFDLTPSVLPLGLTADEILRCYDLETDFLRFATEAVAMPPIAHQKNPSGKSP